MVTLLASLLLPGPSAARAADFVEVRRVCPAIRVELRYATKHNGVGRVVYPSRARCLLRRAVAERLCRVQKRLEKQGLGLLVWDAYRPVSAQRALWKAEPDARFVAPPDRGSRHNRGAAVDLTLAGPDGRPLPMPSEFDEFSARARSHYAHGPAARRLNRDRLHDAMVAEGFHADRNEWWHYEAPEWRRYPLANLSLVGPQKR